MKLSLRQLTASIALFFLMVILTACAPLNQEHRSSIPKKFNPEEIITELTPGIEALYLSWHDLDQIYKDIKFLERGLLFDPNDRQLGYAQKATLYVQDASVRIHHAWEKLAVLHYIRTDSLRDYLTLTVNALTATIDGVGYDDRFLDIYAVYINHAAVRGDVERARDQMMEIVALLNGIRNQLVTMLN